MGDIRNWRKIDLYVNGRYYGTTTWSRTLREAKARLFQQGGVHIDAIVASFAETKQQARLNGRRS